MGPVVSFHLVRDRSVAAALWRLARQRAALRRVPGVTFVRVLGTGRGDDTGPSVDPRRTAVLAVWSGVGAHDAFMARHPLAVSWRRAPESWHCLLQPLRHRGSWGGEAPFGPPPGTAAPHHDGCVVVVTRASIRLRAVPGFVRAGRSLRRSAADADGCLAVVGIGDVPMLRLGTCSVWADADHARAHAEERAHADVAATSRRDGWFTEELFARFAPIASCGAWDGADPLAAPYATPS